MALPAERIDSEAPQSGRIIGAAEWPRQRFSWLESVRRDGDLNHTAKLVAHVLALDYANRETLQCDPSFREIAQALGMSVDSAKRAILALVEGGWIGRQIGRGRGRPSGYVFLSRAQIVPLKGGKFAAPKGGNAAPFSGAVDKSEKGANLPLKGGKSAFRHYKAKPCKNHGAGARGGAWTPPDRISETVMRWGAMIREGDGSMARHLTDLDIRNLLHFGIVTEAQLDAVGVKFEAG